MTDKATWVIQDQTGSRIIRFRVLKISGLTTLPLFKDIHDLPPDSKGNSVYESKDEETFTVHQRRGELLELLDVGSEDGDMKFSVKTGAVEGDETTFIIKVWNGGRKYSIPVPDKDLLSAGEGFRCQWMDD